MGCFIHCQLPLDKDGKTLLRVTENSSGFVKDTDGKSGCCPSKVAEQQAKGMSNLGSSKAYSSLRDEISYVCNFVCDPRNNFMSSLDLFVYLTDFLYLNSSGSELAYLRILSNKI